MEGDIFFLSIPKKYLLGMHENGAGEGRPRGRKEERKDDRDGWMDGRHRDVQRTREKAVGAVDLLCRGSKMMASHPITALPRGSEDMER